MILHKSLYSAFFPIFSHNDIFETTLALDFYYLGALVWDFKISFAVTHWDNHFELLFEDR